MSIPVHVSATSALTHPHRFAGALPVRGLVRLAQAVAETGGDLQAELTADRESGFPRVHGRIEGALTLDCQRCNRPFQWPLRVEMDLRLVFSDQEEKAALASGDPYRVENDELPLRELVEDEVLLALPMLARCETCENLMAEPAPAPERKVETRRDNPFAVLKEKLKQR
jgi:uncharacterized protein